MVLEKFSVLSCILLFFPFLFFDVTFNVRTISTNYCAENKQFWLIYLVLVTEIQLSKFQNNIGKLITKNVLVPLKYYFVCIEILSSLC